MMIRSIAALACTIFATSASMADLLSFEGSPPDSIGGTGCNFSAELDWAYLTGNTGKITLELTNTTPADVGGFLTGFVFNINSTDPAAAADLISASNPFFLDTGPESAPPYGDYDAGAALGASWSGSGGASKGIAVGQTRQFVFEVTANDVANLSAADFVYHGPLDYNFVARFRALADGGSDKVPVPAPGSAALLSLGVLAARRRR